MIKCIYEIKPLGYLKHRNFCKQDLYTMNVISRYLKEKGLSGQQEAYIGTMKLFRTHQKRPCFEKFLPYYYFYKNDRHVMVKFNRYGALLKPYLYSELYGFDISDMVFVGNFFVCFFLNSQFWMN